MFLPRKSAMRFCRVFLFVTLLGHLYVQTLSFSFLVHLELLRLWSEAKVPPSRLEMFVSVRCRMELPPKTESQMRFPGPPKHWQSSLQMHMRPSCSHSFSGTGFCIISFCFPTLLPPFLLGSVWGQPFLHATRRMACFFLIHLYLESETFWYCRPWTWY